ncbi:hypothetical protein GWI33_022296 [Rhynchophorus ferrugineus]|uniref:Uncharacterized protein n=1 Tax=Rhynchophorus ferrugineus TaxID=354439 RepID=A0A834INP4_RHYFE|nr:hypothetical protein GWI33_022296 [Rhynchophorus ferrugineus]
MWTFILSTCISISLLMSLVFCLCWKKKTPNKDEWLGIDGMVTPKNPDENVNHLPSAASCMDGNSNEESFNSSKRNVISSTRRSLPDIPSEMNSVNWDPVGDNSSEHYATLGQYQNANNKSTVRNGLDTRLSVSQHSSISQVDETFSTYERVKYDKINSREHPYAQLQPTTSRPFEENPSGQSSPEERVNLLRAEGSNKSVETSNHVRSRRSSTHSNLGGIEIPAASAVAGGIAANYDLPYMTPPVNQTNFSGDSQDSSKGYTSITVREPLANIIAQTKEINKEKRGLDVNYSTVSDDSDDVYTTIPDPNSKIYSSESETYSKIQQVTVEAEINAIDRHLTNRQELDQLYEPPPQPAPPSVDSLKHVTSHTHSRQASSSSSIANIGSPKPEKRQANSPLPPPPTSSTDKTVHNLDELYAKVCKARRDDSAEDRLSDKGSLNESLRNSLGSSSRSSKGSSVGRKEHNYETLKKSKKSNDPGYEKIKGSNSDFEPGYASINGPDSLASSSDPGYEVLRGREPSEIDPNYEQLRHKPSNVSDSGYSKVRERIDGYSVVNKKKHFEAFEDNCIDEPKYESMSSDVGEPNYSAVRSSDSDIDPNYESVNQPDPNYETVREMKAFRSGSDPKIKTTVSSESSNSMSKTTTTTDSEPPYEQLNNDSDWEIGGYERVGPRSKDSGTSSGNEIPGLQNELAEGDIVAYLHEEDAVVQV